MSKLTSLTRLFFDLWPGKIVDGTGTKGKVCGGDTSLCAEVEALLVPDADSKSVPQPASASVGASRAETVASPKTIGEEPGDVVGSYKLLQKLGEGGSGPAWAAAQ